MPKKRGVTLGDQLLRAGKNISAHPWSFLATLGIDAIFVFLLGFLCLPIIDRIVTRLYAIGSIIQQGAQELGGSLDDVAFNGHIKVIVVLLLLLVIVVYIIYSIYIAYVWRIANGINGVAAGDLLLRIFSINIWWIAIFVLVRTLYFAVRLPLVMGGVDIVVTTWDTIIAIITAALFYVSVVSYQLVVRKDLHPFRHAWRAAITKKALVTAVLVICLLIVGNFIIYALGFALPADWAIAVMVPLTLAIIAYVRVVFIQGVDDAIR